MGEAQSQLQFSRFSKPYDALFDDKPFELEELENEIYVGLKK
jgi:hypothetical protein